MGKSYRWKLRETEGGAETKKRHTGTGVLSAQDPCRLYLPLFPTSSVLWSSVGEEWVLADLEALLGIRGFEVCCTEQDWVGLGGQIAHKT